jgi:ankyrin repeat protein
MPTPEKKRELINRKTRGGDTALVLATRSRSPEAVRYLVDVGMSVFGPDYLEFWGSSALIEAVTHREYRAQPERDRLKSRQTAAIILTELLQKGADANTADENGVTVLMRAIQAGSDLSVIQSLMTHKANPRAIDNSGRDAYHYARERTDGDDVVRILGK